MLEDIYIKKSFVNLKKLKKIKHVITKVELSQTSNMLVPSHS